MNTVHLSGLWNLYVCQAQLSIITHVCHQESLQEGTLISLHVCFKMNQTVVDALIVSMICLTHSDKYILANDRHIAVADHFVLLWALVLLCGTLQ